MCLRAHQSTISTTSHPRDCPPLPVMKVQDAGEFSGSPKVSLASFCASLELFFWAVAPRCGSADHWGQQLYGLYPMWVRSALIQTYQTCPNHPNHPIESSKIIKSLCRKAAIVHHGDVFPLQSILTIHAFTCG